jgi:hypothetical protein
MTVKTNSVGVLIAAFQLTLVEFGDQLGMEPYPSEDVKGVAAGGEVKR